MLSSDILSQKTERLLFHDGCHERKFGEKTSKPSVGFQNAFHIFAPSARRENNMSIICFPQKPIEDDKYFETESEHSSRLSTINSFSPATPSIGTNNVDNAIRCRTSQTIFCQNGLPTASNPPRLNHLAKEEEASCFLFPPNQQHQLRQILTSTSSLSKKR
ncbi:hypothetical protein NPIL_16571 [Nephila pilipes]|uniref:Uncharacterized protein n=1 Tax=Nephila pilipes TaxID=299642 RepID=A0A8X6QKK8_NEPPI|nr:hypothetical protein NPIL_16571 [Nephila pilipes]